MRNSYTDMIERLCVEVIPGWTPPVQVRITGRYAMGDTVTELQAKTPGTNHININIKLGGKRR